MNRESKALQVTTYGVPPYDYATLQSDPDAVTALQPVVVSRFSVVPVRSLNRRPQSRQRKRRKP